MVDKVVIGGDISLRNVIDGDFTLQNALDGETGVFTKVGDLPPSYEGEYTVTPSLVQQVLDTSGKIMTDDVTIEPIGDVYEGDIVIAPSTQDQVLDTDHKYNPNDITVKKIAFAEVDNLSGGTTISIGE